MDKLNINILKELQANSRRSFAEIGRKVGLSAPSIAERIQKLEESGIIEGYSLSLNKSKLGLNVEAIIYLDVLFQNYRKLIKDLDDIPEVQECFKVTGKHSVILKVAVKDHSELETVIDKISLYGQPQTSIILSSYVNKRVLLLNKAQRVANMLS